MHAIKRSDSELRRRQDGGVGGGVGGSSSSTGGGGGSNTSNTNKRANPVQKTSQPVAATPTPSSGESTQPTGGAGGSKLVFGLSSRTNQVKHAEYAEQRRRQQPEASARRTSERAVSVGVEAGARGAEVALREAVGKNSTPPATNTNTTSRRADLEAPQAQKAAAPTTAAPTTTTTTTTAPSKTVRASKYGNFYKPQDLVTGASSSSSSSQQTPPAAAVAVAEVAAPHRPSQRQQQQVARAQQQQQQPQQPKQPQQQQRQRSPAPSSARSRSRSPESRTAARGAAMARRKSIEEDLSTTKRIETTKTQQQQQDAEPPLDSPNDQQQQQQLAPPKPRTQFNVLPPPQLVMATTGRASVVSYAKSRIYDRPARPTTVAATATPAAAAAAGERDHLGRSSIWNNTDAPAAILCGFKPPKQVNVSKAREQWEGGEPFAKCKSRQRLAAKAAAAGHKKHLLGTWSMTSVVATQQLQLQQALAAASAAVRSSPEQTDPSVKVLTRGSVLERVQQFERAPPPPPPSSSPSYSRSSSLSSLSSLSSASSSSVSDADDAAAAAEGPAGEPDTGPEAEAVITINTNTNDRQQPVPVEPSSRQAQYKSRVSKIQQKQQAEALNEAAPKSPPAAPIQQQQAQQRRLSFRRRSSLGAAAAAGSPLDSKENIGSSSSGGSYQLIPRFYHPKGKPPNTYEIEVQKRQIVACFDKFPERRAQLEGPLARRHFHSIALACSLSEYFKVPLLLYVKHHLERGPTTNGWPDCRGPPPPQQPLLRRRTSVAAGPPSAGGPLAARRPLTRSSSATAPDQAAGAANSSNNNSNKTTTTTNHVTCDQFLAAWRKLISGAYDKAARFIHLLTLGARDHLLPDDFIPLVQSIIDDHPGLRFLRAAPDFHMRYIQTVIARIYFCVNRSWTGKISLAELRRSNLLAVLEVLAQEEDINQITDYFSYEHFYVIYCKFWALDQDHDLLISKADLARHQEASISARIIERIFSGCCVSRQLVSVGGGGGCKGGDCEGEKAAPGEQPATTTTTTTTQTMMTFTDFVWFLIAEEDKRHPRSIEYWFRLMDLDGDGYLSMYELEYFYYEQARRLELMNIEPLPFLDCACQILDLVNPREKHRISLADLKRTKLVGIFFDTFINLEKYLEHESREFVSSRELVQDGVLVSDWDRYAAEEYESLVSAEETSV